jgi:multiple sugar transport system ATP-binding protein
VAQITIQNLNKRFAGFTAVRDTNLTIDNGRFVVLLGPSGCGKTTTLRMVAGLELPTAGRIMLDGRDVTWLTARERDIAFVFQLFALYPHMSVRQNIAFPLQNERLPRAEITSRVSGAARLLRIEHILDRGVGGLSGGDRQRVALGRAIVRQPQAFLMDEPLGTLDTEFRELMCLELRKLHNQLGATTVYVTHDQSEAMAMADEIVVMNLGEVLQAGPPAAIYHFPASVFVGSFIGSPPMNFLPVEGSVSAQATEVRIGGAMIAVPRVMQGCDEALLGIRPEHVVIDAGGPLRGNVIADEYLGSHQILVVETSAGNLRMRASKDTIVEPGANITLMFRKERTLLYDRKTERLLDSESVAVHRAGHLNG